MKPLKSLILAAGILLASCNINSFPIPELPTEPSIPPTQIEEEVLRDDFYAILELGEYNLGDDFIYAGRVQSKHLENILISNETGGFAWNVIKDGEIVDSKDVTKLLNNEPYSIEMKEYGYVDFKQQDDKLVLIIGNSIIKYGPIDIDVPNIIWHEFEIHLETMKPYTFTELGEYVLDFSIGYQFEGEDYKVLYKSEMLEIK